jgi:hypothetical protein
MSSDLTSMEPLLPRHEAEAATLRGLAVDVIRESAALGGALRFDDLDRVVAAVASHHRLLWIVEVSPKGSGRKKR